MIFLSSFYDYFTKTFSGVLVTYCCVTNYFSAEGPGATRRVPSLSQGLWAGVRDRAGLLRASQVAGLPSRPRLPHSPTHMAGAHHPWEVSAPLRVDPSKEASVFSRSDHLLPGELSRSHQAFPDFASEATWCHFHSYSLFPSSHKPGLVQCGRGLHKGVRTRRRQSPRGHCRHWLWYPASSNRDIFKDTHLE